MLLYFIHCNLKFYFSFLKAFQLDSNIQNNIFLCTIII